jgi:Leucine-rich repeat (LRR) protein
LFFGLAVQIAPGSLPKGLHSLDLSRNKIAVIEGLRELTRLRVLNLSYNRITRIGHGKHACPGNFFYVKCMSGALATQRCFYFYTTRLAFLPVI